MVAPPPLNTNPQLSYSSLFFVKIDFFFSVDAYFANLNDTSLPSCGDRATRRLHLPQDTLLCLFRLFPFFLPAPSLNIPLIEFEPSPHLGRAHGRARTRLRPVGPKSLPPSSGIVPPQPFPFLLFARPSRPSRWYSPRDSSAPQRKLGRRLPTTSSALPIFRTFPASLSGPAVFSFAFTSAFAGQHRVYQPQPPHPTPRLVASYFRDFLSLFCIPAPHSRFGLDATFFSAEREADAFLWTSSPPA